MAIREKKNTGPSGLARVTINKKNVRVDFQGGDTYELGVDAVEAGTQGGLYNVTLSGDRTKAYLHPVPGQYMFSFKQMGNRTNNIPATKITAEKVLQRRDGKGSFMLPAEHVFVAQFQIENEGMYHGMTVASQLPYSFVSPVFGENCDIYDGKRNLGRLETFFKAAAGVDNIGMLEVPYNPDPVSVLVWLEKFVQDKSTWFLGTLNEKGFLDMDTISRIPADLLPKKKPAKTTKSARK